MNEIVCKYANEELFSPTHPLSSFKNFIKSSRASAAHLFLRSDASFFFFKKKEGKILGKIGKKVRLLHLTRQKILVGHLNQL
jgi:hypothetical protein